MTSAPGAPAIPASGMPPRKDSQARRRVVLCRWQHSARVDRLRLAPTTSELTATVNADRGHGASNGRAATLWCPRRAVWATAPADATTLSRAGTLGRAPADRRYGSPQCGAQLVNRDHEHVPINAVPTASSCEAENRNRPSATPPSPPADNPGRLHPYVDQMPLLISRGLRLDHHGQAGGRNRDRVDITRPQPPQRMPQPPASVSRTASAR